MIRTSSMTYESLLADARATLASPLAHGYDFLQVLCPVVCHARIPGFDEFYEATEDLEPSAAQRAEAAVLAKALQGRLNAWYQSGRLGQPRPVARLAEACCRAA